MLNLILAEIVFIYSYLSTYIPTKGAVCRKIGEVNTYTIDKDNDWTNCRSS